MSEMDVRGNEADGLLDEPAPEQAGNASINSLDNSTESPRFEDVERRHEVLSVVPFEQVIIGKLLGNTALYCGLQVTVVACAAATLTMAGEMFAAIANLTRPNDLLYITALLVAVGFASQLLTLRSVRTSLGPNGPLVQLGAGVQYISASDAKKLDRWRIGLACISAVSIVVGALNFGSGICGMDLAHRTDRVLMGHERVWFVLTGTYLALVLPILTSGWASSLLAAKQLSYDSIMVAIKHAEATNPVDHATWHAEVVLPALQLQEKMQWLSDGWGGGLQGAFVFFGFVGLALGTLIMNAQWCDGADAFYGLRPGLMRVYSCAAIAFVDSLPLLLARHVAATSSRCGRLIEKLNDARIKAGPDHNDRISWLRQSLKDVVRAQLARIRTSTAICVVQAQLSVAMTDHNRATRSNLCHVSVRAERRPRAGGPNWPHRHQRQVTRQSGNNALWWSHNGLRNFACAG